MGLELYLVGVIVEDMPRAIEFYRRPGVEFAEGSERKQHVEVKMSGLTFFLNTKEQNSHWDLTKAKACGGYRILLDFLPHWRSEALFGASLSDLHGMRQKIPTSL